jgi:hypothetical protein
VTRCNGCPKRHTAAKATVRPSICEKRIRSMGLVSRLLEIRSLGSETVGTGNRELRTTFEPTRDDVTGGWRKLHNDELHNLYSSPGVIRMDKAQPRMMKLVRYVVRIREKRNAYRLLVGKPEGMRPLGTSGCRWGITLIWIL